ncbi:hypothetical protein D9758_000896 [Tetrapyrgos nigripes]|uniref:Uncharacterized protein n=1 Tax=Tetrapyrgos nigripes TaxID=182062 RepID=A0A8H5GYV9_9AGAR|nr:hypothetical protein D9758_000896 [Tetrapyrgos nigripes]
MPHSRTAKSNTKKSESKEKEDIHKAQSKIKKLEEEKEYWMAKATAAERLWKEKSEQLAAAEFFMTEADTYSISDIISMVRQLNSEVHQTAAAIADVCSEYCQHTQFPPLPCHDETIIPVPMQYILQTALLAWCKQALCRWGPDRAMCEGLSNAYADIKKRGKKVDCMDSASTHNVQVDNPVILRAWRALTREGFAQSPTRFEEDYDILHNAITTMLRGCHGLEFAVVQGLKLDEKIESIVKLVCRLDEAVTKTHYTDVALLIPACGDSFSETMMEDVCGSFETRKDGNYQVSAVCELGLETVGERRNVELKARVLVLEIPAKQDPIMVA